MAHSSPFDLAKLQEQHDLAIAGFLKKRSVDVVEVNAFLDGPYGGSSSDRASLVARWAASLKPEAGGRSFWQVLTEQWPSFDRIDHAEYRRQFRRFERYWDPTRELMALKAKMTVYRGQSALHPMGLSWTLRREVAEGFARGHRGIGVPSATVLERRIRREQVALVFMDERQEQEVVLWAPPRNQRA